MIYCVWYPSGGFGHFVNAVLTMHGRGFARSGTAALEFSAAGDSHSFPLAAPKYAKDPGYYDFDFDPGMHYSVLVDNGIDNEGQTFLDFFPDSQIIKICYTNWSWPIVARTLIDKAMNSSIQVELPTNPDAWPDGCDWDIREKYFLYLRDHDFRHAWKPGINIHNLLVDDLLDYDHLAEKINSFDIVLDDFQPDWQRWKTANATYIDPVLDAREVIDAVKQQKIEDLKHVTDIWAQAVLYYLLWLEFGREVPHNDYAGFFNDTGEIVRWLAS